MSENSNVGKTDFATVLKNEIVRLAKKQIKAELEPYKAAAAKTRAQIAALRADIARLEKTVAKLQKQVDKVAPPVKRFAQSDTENSRKRFTAKGFASLRARLALSHAQMGQLVGASDQSIRKWEEGDSTPRAPFQQAIFALRGIGKKEVAARLAKLQQ